MKALIITSKKIFFFSLIFLSSLMFFNSCNRQKEDVIVFDNTYPLALAPNVYWALVTDPYAAYKKELGWNSESTGHCRRGEIIQVKGQSKDKENVRWYLFENGWLPETCLSIYSNRFKAETAASQLKD